MSFFNVRCLYTCMWTRDKNCQILATTVTLASILHRPPPPFVHSGRCCHRVEIPRIGRLLPSQLPREKILRFRPNQKVIYLIAVFVFGQFLEKSWGCLVLWIQTLQRPIPTFHWWNFDVNVTLVAGKGGLFILGSYVNVWATNKQPLVTSYSRGGEWVNSVKYKSVWEHLRQVIVSWPLVCWSSLGTFIVILCQNWIQVSNNNSAFILW